MVLLNGPSSSGKTSIGRAMLPLLDDPWFFVPVDAVSGLRSESYRRALDDAGITEMLQRTRRGYHRAVAGLASVGNDVIMDYPLSEPWRLADLLEVLEPFEVLLVDVTCAPEELVRRELARGDRPVGLAASQAVFAHPERDLVVDTTATPADACARAVVRLLEESPSPTAFERMRARAAGGATNATSSSLVEGSPPSGRGPWV